MKTEKDTVRNNIAFLRELSGELRSHFDPHRKIFILWGMLIASASLLSQLLLTLEKSGILPYIWITAVLCGFLISRFLSRGIISRQQVRPALLRYLVVLWAGGSAVIFLYFLIACFFNAVSLQYFAVLMFPVIALCILVTGAFFKSAAAYVISAVFLLAAVPAVLFPEFSMILTAVVMGGGILVFGLIKNG